MGNPILRMAEGDAVLPQLRERRPVARGMLATACLAKFLRRAELQRVEALVRAGGLISRGPASWGPA